MNERSFLTWLTVGHLANDWPIAALWLIAPAAGLSMGLTPAEVGLLFTVFNIGGALAYLPFGILADHVSNRGRLLTLTFWWVAVGYVAAALAPDFWSLALLLAFAGMGNAAWHPIAAGVLMKEAKDRRAHALGVHAMGGSAAEILAPVCAGVLLSIVDWRLALILSAVPTVLLGIAFFVRVSRAVERVPARPFRRADWVGLVASWRQGSGLRLITMISLYNMALMALLSMIPLYLADARGVSVASLGLAFSALLVAGAITQPWVGSVSDRVGRRPVIVVGNLVAAAAALVLITEPPFWLMFAAMAIAVAALDAIRSTMLAAAVDRTDHREGTTLGLAFLLMDGVGALGAVLAGLAAGASWGHMFALAAALSMGTVLLALTLPFVPAPHDKTASGAA